LYEDIVGFLNKNKIDFEEFSHEAAKTSAEAAVARGMKEEGLEKAVKAMILRSKGKFYLFALRASKKIDWKKVRKILGTDSVSLATPEEVLKVMGVEIGACAPFGNLVSIPTYADTDIYSIEKFVFSCGKHDKSIEIKVDDWDKIVKPIRVGFSA